MIHKQSILYVNRVYGQKYDSDIFKSKVLSNKSHILTNYSILKIAAILCT